MTEPDTDTVHAGCSAPRLSSTADPYIQRDAAGELAWGINIDAADRRADRVAITGWSFGIAAIEVWEGDSRVAAAEAFSPRHDVVLALGGRVGPDLGFRLDVPTEASELLIRGVRPDGERCDFVLSGIGQAVDEAPPAWIGAIERIEDGIVHGWAYPQDGSATGALRVVCGGRDVGVAESGIFREDLLRSGFANGRYGFRFELPAAFDWAGVAALELFAGDERVQTGSVPVPVFNALAATRCFAGEAGVHWPYCISGRLRLARRTSVRAFGIAVGEQVIARREIVWDADIDSPDFDTCAFSHVFDPSVPLAAGLTVWLVFDGIGKVAVGRTGAPPRAAGGVFEVADNAVRGQLTGDFGQDGALRGQLLIDRVPCAPIEVIAGGERGRAFSVRLPNWYFDGASHLLAVVNDSEGACLTTTDGACEYAYRAPAVGTVDAWEPPFLRGWAFDLLEKGSPAVVELYDGDEPVARSVCRDQRGDVSRIFRLKTASAYSIAVPAHLFDGRKLRLNVRCNGVRLAPGAQCQVPHKLTAADLAAVPPAARIRGRVEQLNSRVVAGWAWDLMRTDEPVQLVVRVDGESIGTTLASRFSARLRDDCRSGHQQFQFELPDELLAGRRRTITVHDIATGFAVPCPEGSEVEFPLTLLPRPEKIAPMWAPPPPPGFAASGSSAAVAAPALGEPMASVIVLNLNGDHLLRALLDSLVQVAPRIRYELLMVDHGSTDDSVDVIRGYADRLPIRLFERGRNYSFSESNNFAARAAHGNCLVFANNDLVLQEDCLSALCAHLQDPSIGIVGARLLEPLRGPGGWMLLPHHEGVRFKPRPLADGGVYYCPYETVGLEGETTHATRPMPVVTAALMACRRDDFLRLGGFSERYRYGLEDVDFCLYLRRQLGLAVIADLGITAIHNRSATREEKFATRKEVTGYSSRTHRSNLVCYLQRFGRRITRDVLRSLVEGRNFYRTRPLRVAFVVSESAADTVAGDYYTALELGSAMREKYGYDVLFCEYRNHHLPDVDIVVVMRHDYELRRTHGMNPGVVTVAWIRNRTDEWIARDEFADYNLVMASSHRIVDYVRQNAGRAAVLLPIAANPVRFRPEPPSAQHASDVVFTGTYHAAVRSAAMFAHYSLGDATFAIYGYNWGNFPALAGHARGSLPYDTLRDAYNGAKLVLDDGHPVTRDWASLNSRVFDALACGKLVVTNCTAGSDELFGGRLPTFSSADELDACLKRYLGDPDARERLARELHEAVLAKHTYAHRAETFQQALLAFLDERRLRFAIKIGVPQIAECDRWGDYHFALGIKRALERRGHFVRIDILPDWYGGTSASDDVVLVLRGLSRYTPRATAINLLWVISHPDDVSVAEMLEYDHVFAASPLFTARHAPSLGERASTLLQCTDTQLFARDAAPAPDVPPVLFVGNSRDRFRTAVRYAMEAGVDFGVIGGGWEGIIPARYVIADHVSNAELRTYYSAARVVLNDHWDDMRDNGFVSNRVFDVGACGTPLLTDGVEGLDRLFPEGSLVFDSAESFARTVHAVLQDPRPFEAAARRRAEQVLAAHTFDHRVDDLLAVLPRVEARLGR